MERWHEMRELHHVWLLPIIRQGSQIKLLSNRTITGKSMSI